MHSPTPEMDGQCGGTAGASSADPSTSMSRVGQPDKEAGGVRPPEQLPKSGASVPLPREGSQDHPIGSDVATNEVAAGTHPPSTAAARPQPPPDDVTDSICAECETGGDLLCCDGPCLRAFHPECIDEAPPDVEQWFCFDCHNKVHRCFACKHYAPEEDLVECARRACGKWFHATESCLGIKAHTVLREYVCDRHRCHSCQPHNPDGAGDGVQPRRSMTAGDALVQCFRCPTAYHTRCRPGDVHTLDATYFLCMLHVQADDALPPIDAALLHRLQASAPVRREVAGRELSTQRAARTKSGTGGTLKRSNLTSGKASTKRRRTARTKTKVVQPRAMSIQAKANSAEFRQRLSLVGVVGASGTANRVTGGVRRKPNNKGSNAPTRRVGAMGRALSRLIGTSGGGSGREPASSDGVPRAPGPPQRQAGGHPNGQPQPRSVHSRRAQAPTRADHDDDAWQKRKLNLPVTPPQARLLKRRRVTAGAQQSSDGGPGHSAYSTYSTAVPMHALREAGVAGVAPPLASGVPFAPHAMPSRRTAGAVMAHGQADWAFEASLPQPRRDTRPLGSRAAHAAFLRAPTLPHVVPAPAAPPPRRRDNHDRTAAARKRAEMVACWHLCSWTIVNGVAGSRVNDTPRHSPGSGVDDSAASQPDDGSPLPTLPNPLAALFASLDNALYVAGAALTELGQGHDGASTGTAGDGRASSRVNRSGTGTAGGGGGGGAPGAPTTTRTATDTVHGVDVSSLLAAVLTHTRAQRQHAQQQEPAPSTSLAKLPEHENSAPPPSGTEQTATVLAQSSGSAAGAAGQSAATQPCADDAGGSACAPLSVAQLDSSPTLEFRSAVLGSWPCSQCVLRFADPMALSAHIGERHSNHHVAEQHACLQRGWWSLKAFLEEV